MTRLFLILPLALLACDIRNDRPDFEYPAASRATGTDWPELAVTAELAAAGDAVSAGAEDRQAEAERLAARARGLEQRAARLRRTTQ